MKGLKKYERYTPSGNQWLDDIPESWKIEKIKNISELIVSNVDKHSKPLEQSIQLCNYVDVYKNDFITSEIDFMKATATQDEINKFKLKYNDVVLTKDSEDWLDIGVPALISYEHENFICAYHLAILRSDKNTYGRFLHRALLSSAVRSQFSIHANGITRYGISKGVIANTCLPLPSIDEQTKIANYLDQKTAQIDTAVTQKTELIARLKERRQILIDTAVTRGIDPHTAMKESDLPWIGQIPAHWEIKRAKYLFHEIDERSTTGEEELLSVSHLTGITPRSEKNVSMFMAEDYSGSKICRKNDLVFNIMWAWMGALGVSDRTGIVSPSYGVYRQQHAQAFNPIFLEHLLRSTEYVSEYNRRSTGLHSSRLRLYSHMFFNMYIGFPPKEEQEKIVQYIRSNSEKIDYAIALQQQQIEKLHEYKATLIDACVTGKVKVP